MRKFGKIAAVLFVGFLVGCNQQPTEQVIETAYQWEKSYMDNDYEKQQQLLFEKGTFEVHKNKSKEDSGLKSEDIRYEVYYDDEFDWYYVLTEYTNPQHGNGIDHELVIREKDKDWKVDMEANEDLIRDEIQENFERTACINCK